MVEAGESGDGVGVAFVDGADFAEGVDSAGGVIEVLFEDVGGAEVEGDAVGVVGGVEGGAVEEEGDEFGEGFEFEVDGFEVFDGLEVLGIAGA